MNRRLFSLLALSISAVASAWSGADPAVVAAVIEEGKNHNQVMNHLRYLTKNIGARLTGSPQLQRACEWTASKFREYGLQNVHL